MTKDTAKTVGIQRWDITEDDFKSCMELADDGAFMLVTDHVKAIEVLRRALQSANTYLRDISELKEENFTKMMTDLDMFNFAKEVAQNGYEDSSKALSQSGVVNGKD